MQLLPSRVTNETCFKFAGSTKLRTLVLAGLQRQSENRCKFLSSPLRNGCHANAHTAGIAKPCDSKLLMEECHIPVTGSSWSKCQDEPGLESLKGYSHIPTLSSTPLAAQVLDARPPQGVNAISYSSSWETAAELSIGARPRKPR